MDHRGWGLVASMCFLACGGPPAPATSTPPAASWGEGSSTPPSSMASAAPSADEKTSLCEDADADDCKTRCDRGDRTACALLGDIYAKNPDDRAKAGPLLDQTCRMKVSDHETKLEKGRTGAHNVCGAVGYMHSGGMMGLKKDPAKAIEVWELGCKGPDADTATCTMLLNELLRGTEVPRDPKHALTIAPLVCEATPSTNACLLLASMLERGDGVPKDTKRAEEMFDKACTGKSTDACKALHSRAPHALEP